MPSWAHQGDRVFLIWELPTADLPNLHDGTLEDWEAVLPEESLTHNDWRFPSGQSGLQPVDTDDIAMRLFMAWHNAGQQIYVGVEVLDDIADRSDAFMFMVDGDHSGGDYNPSPRNVENLEAVTRAQYYYSPLHPFDSTDFHRPTGSTAWAYEAPWFDEGRAEFGELPTQTVLEMKLTPWDHIGGGPDTSGRTRLAGGNIIGFQLNFFDSDQGLDVGIFVIGNVFQAATQYNANMFADAELIPCFVLDCSGATTTVRADSWGRIKASFR